MDASLRDERASVNGASLVDPLGSIA